MSKIEIPFYWLDVFTSEPFKGNPVAVFMMNTDLDDSLYLKLAKELKLSKIAFTEKIGESEYKLRYFSPNGEVPLCGHATIGTAYTLSTEYNVQSQITFQTRDEQIEVEIDGSQITINFPQRPLPDSHYDGMAAPLGIKEYEECYVVMFVLKNREQVEKVNPDYRAFRAYCEAHDMSAAIVTALDDSGECDYLCRVFMMDEEDPVTGLSQCYLAPYWSKRLGKSKMRCHQISHRPGIVSVELVDDVVRITSKATMLMKGTLSLPI